MELKKLTPEQERALCKPLPKEAIKPHPTKTYLSTIKAIYVAERLNQVFGIGQWEIHGEKVIESGEKMVVIEAELTIPEYGIRLRSYGGNDNADRGDAYKGAVTDALTKIGSHLGIGMDVFKGLGDKSDHAEEPIKRDTPTDAQLQHAGLFLSDISDATAIEELKKIHSAGLDDFKKGLLTQIQWDKIGQSLTKRKAEIKGGANG